jgi:hypothetical protein
MNRGFKIKGVLFPVLSNHSWGVGGISPQSGTGVDGEDHAAAQLADNLLTNFAASVIH